MKVFLTGATGYIGGAIAEKLQEYGHEVLGLARSESSAAKLRERGYSAHPGDLNDLASLAQGAREADGVIHAAATDGHTHYAALSAILPAIAGTGKPLVYTSGSLIYGETGPEPIDEDTPVSGEHVHFHVIDEALIFDKKWEVRPSAIRVPLAFGRGGGNLQLQLIDMARQLGKAAYVAPGENR
jgi:nucleoside-diphosphate-sugar epimerase